MKTCGNPAARQKSLICPAYGAGDEQRVDGIGQQILHGLHFLGRVALGRDDDRALPAKRASSVKLWLRSEKKRFVVFAKQPDKEWSAPSATPAPEGSPNSPSAGPAR